MGTYVAELKGKDGSLGSPRSLALSDGGNTATAWSHDSKTVFFLSDRTGKEQIFKQQLDQDNAEHLDTGPAIATAEPTPDGAWILYWSQGEGAEEQSVRLMRFPVSGGSPEAILKIPFDATIDLHCPSRATGSCVISRGAHGEVAFYALDPVHGQGKELARTKLPQPYDINWSLSSDGSRVAIKSKDQLPGRIPLWIWARERSGICNSRQAGRSGIRVGLRMGRHCMRQLRRRVFFSLALSWTESPGFCSIGASINSWVVQ
jgi:hypothetical protein